MEKEIICISRLKPTYALEKALKPFLHSKIASNVFKIKCTTEEAIELLTNHAKEVDYIDLVMLYGAKKIQNV